QYSSHVFFGAKNGSESRYHSFKAIRSSDKLGPAGSFKNAFICRTKFQNFFFVLSPCLQACSTAKRLSTSSRFSRSSASALGPLPPPGGTESSCAAPRAGSLAPSVPCPSDTGDTDTQGDSGDSEIQVLRDAGDLGHSGYSRDTEGREGGKPARPR